MRFKTKSVITIERRRLFYWKIYFIEFFENIFFHIKIFFFGYFFGFFHGVSKKFFLDSMLGGRGDFTPFFGSNIQKMYGGGGGSKNIGGGEGVRQKRL